MVANLTTQAQIRYEKILLDQVVLFFRVLHEAGLAVNSANLIDLCRCFEFIDISNREDFYATARATLVSNQADIERFDELFIQFWQQPDKVLLSAEKKDASDNLGGEEEEDNQEKMQKQLQADDDEGGDQAAHETLSELAYSADEVLMQKDLSEMSAIEVERARQMIKEFVAIIANYKSRRYVADKKRARLDFRRMMRRNALFEQVGLNMAYKARRIKKTKLVLLCDVSGSMERYSTFFIEFIYALKAELPDLEVAVFSTRMTMITELLKAKTVEESLAQVSAQVHDWAGGTNIGGCLREFNDRFAREMLHSRSVVIILSDGWDRGDAYLMREEMEHLHSRVHKLMWLNPLLGGSDYQPICRGMQTALPYLDYFLPVHNLESLAELARTLRTVWR